MSIFNELVFVDKIEYDCTICLNVCNMTVSLKPCGHIFCKNCILRWAENSSSCPNCKIKFDEILDSPWHDSKIIGMKVKCIYNTTGCNYVCSLRNIEEHIKNCTYGPIECKFNCKQKFSSSEINDHYNICNNRTVSCILNCNKAIRYCDMNNHLQQVCDNVLINCDNNGCTMNFLRKDKLQHIDNCSYSLIKCSIQDCNDIIIRKDYDKHINDTVYHMQKKINKLEKYKKIIQNNLLHNNIKLLWINSNIECNECKKICKDGYECYEHCNYTICEDCVLYKQYNILKTNINMIKVKYTDNDIIGKKVIKGRDWKWGVQDCKKEGTIVSFGDTTGWVKIKWSDNNINTYRAGVDNMYDLYYL
jgi:hypothetical protein